MLLLDGGSTSIFNFLTEPEPEHSSPLLSRLWTASYSQSSPAAVQKWHKSYLRAGSDIITTNTYQIPPASYYPDIDIPGAMQSSVQAAVSAVKQHRKGSVALSLGTRNSIVGKREYDTAPLFSVDEYYRFHQERLEDYQTYLGELPEEIKYLAFETVSSFEEADAILSLLATERHTIPIIQQTKAWITFSVGDASLSRMSNILSKLLENPNINRLWGVGFNCVGIDIVGDLARELERMIRERNANLWLVLYPDAGMFYDKTTAQFTDKARPLEEEDVKNWASEIAEIGALNGGKVVLGGCCNTDDRFIAELAQKARSR